MKPNTKAFTLVYATQQGNSKEIAESISESSEKYDLECQLFCISEFGKKLDINKIDCLVIVGATTGLSDCIFIKSLI